jgi:hypothetical protein
LTPISILKLIINSEYGEILPHVPNVNSIFITMLIIFLSQENKSNLAERAVALAGILDPLFTFITFNFLIPYKD